MTIMQSGADVVVQVRPKGVTVVNADGSREVLQIPNTPGEMRALLSQRREISDQLGSVTGRRNDIIDKLRTVPDDARPGLHSQLEVLDARIIQLEKDLGTVGQEVSRASPQLLSDAYEQPASNPSPSVRFQQGMVSAGVPIFVIMSAVYFFSWRRWKRQARRAAPTLPSADSERLQRLEHGVDAMAIEIERISEGQRFVTRLLSQTHASESTVGR